MSSKPRYTLSSSTGRSSAKKASSGPNALPKSVKNAPVDQRLAIRRKQNSESAKRSREREKQEERTLKEVMRKNNENISQLEARVQSLTVTLEKKHKKNAQAAARRAKAKAKASSTTATSCQSGNGMMRGDAF